MRKVVIESPYAGKSEDPEEYAREVERNLRYLRVCMADSFAKGEAPFASHDLYTQPGVLDDKIPDERAKGIKAGFAWGECADLRVFYMDLGMSGGMEAGRDEAVRLGQAVTSRLLGDEWEDVAGEVPADREHNILMDAIRKSIPELEHPAEPTPENWAWQVCNMADDRRAVYKALSVAEDRFTVEQGMAIMHKATGEREARRAKSFENVLNMARTGIEKILAMETWAGAVCGQCLSSIDRANDVFNQLRSLKNAIIPASENKKAGA